MIDLKNRQKLSEMINTQLSKGFIFVDKASFLNQFTPVKIGFMLPRGYKVELLGNVNHSSDGTGTTISFDNISDETLNLMTKLSRQDNTDDVDQTMVIYQQIQKMSVGEKVLIALQGDKNTRRILLKEPDEPIQHALLKNPSITLDEIWSISANPKTSAPVLEAIAENNIWIVKNEILLSLVRNPSTPDPIAIVLLDKLALNDLKQLANSSRVKQTVSEAAKMLYNQYDQSDNL